MIFKNKLIIAFSSVLFLTIVVALTNWWGMGSALRAQKVASSLISEIVLGFQEIVQEEQAYRSTKTIAHSRAVDTLLVDLKTRINTLSPQVETPQHFSIIQDALLALENYEKSFLKYKYAIVTMQTMKSRMLKESDRLLLSAGKLIETDQRSDHDQNDKISWNVTKKTNELTELKQVTEILYLVGKVLLGEKDYLLFGEKDAVEAVNNAVHAIRTQASSIEQGQTGSTDKLKSFRIAKIATLYLNAFNQFAAEKRELSTSGIDMQRARDSFSGAMSRSLEQQQVLSNREIATLQYLSVAVSILAVLIGIGAVIILSNMITRPINELKRSVRTIVDGDLDTYVDIYSDDDIGKLGILFNQMIKRLRKSFHDIEQYRNHLEDLVQERTEKLEREIAKQQSTEEALRSSSERLTNIIEQSPMGIVIFDNEFKVQSWNSSCEKIFGYTQQEMRGEIAYKIVAEGAMDRVDEIFNDLIKNRRNVRNRNENITKGGRVITCEWYNTCLTDSTGEMIGMLSLVEDVTGQIQLEKEQLKSKKLESTGVLAGGIAHDFNNILTAILGNINLSLQDPVLQKKTKKMLIDAEKASIRAQSLTQQLLTFAKGGEPIKKQTSLVDVIKDSAEFILHGSSTYCRYHLPDDLWLIDADQGQISQVIQNIVINASHAMSGGGVIDISCSNVEKRSVEDGFKPGDKDYVKIVIADTGEGMPGKTLERIFDPYYSTKKGGSGLGLAISQAIIVKHNGQISVVSVQGSGAEFTIYLPATRKAVLHRPVAKPAKPAEAETTKKLKILVMDDEQMILEVTSQMLLAMGHEVVVSRDGDECIRLYLEAAAAGSPPELIIMDLTIPGGKGGVETIGELLQINPQIKAFVSSGYSNDPAMASYREYGFCGTIPKPYVMKDMEKIIVQILDEHP